jgi:hypothetical protein
LAAAGDLNDLELAARCFGYSSQRHQTQGGVAAAIANADGETSLDLQTVAAVAPVHSCGLCRPLPPAS